ncbi:hypothetical protein IWQ60_011402 [Tieghemiomyces parasiticus]|uniref:Nucleoside phosphorylase domain-containing protein n=1 Tax=Tieghemiomyces parasiticus TaxID=78921 RepID=A0A9W7ZIP8_9FUNG|nr:hypothetical protein IWQ60_011402 [Tieghemiomyces parasiticus]
MAQPHEISNANFPVDDQGRTYHVELKPGQVANRIITVGDPDRADKFAAFLDQTRDGQPLFRHQSHRGFYSITGTYRGVPVSLVAIGMGMSMMDFFVREVRAVTTGPLAIIRFGSCGTLGPADVGDIIVPTEAVAVTRNYDYFTGDAVPPYHISQPVAADPVMSELLATQLVKLRGADHVFTGLNATCDSFYSSQGRTDPQFTDANLGLFDELQARYPTMTSLEMETFMLYHLASVSQTPTGGTPSVRAAAAMMVFAQRRTNAFIDKARVAELETTVGLAVLETLLATPLNEAT